jgi:uncharacterized protein with HEPN domain
VTTLVRPDRRALLELEALLSQIELLREAGDRQRYIADGAYRWAIHRLWISVGNEASWCLRTVRAATSDAQVWLELYGHRNWLAHLSLPDVDDDEVWRLTTVVAGSYRRRACALLN